MVSLIFCITTAGMYITLPECCKLYLESFDKSLYNVQDEIGKTVITGIIELIRGGRKWLKCGNLQKNYPIE